MSDADALLAAIAADPDDDTPRLAYADWLDEHDEPVRAEFIRVQIEVARVEVLPRAVVNERVGLLRRQDELLTAHRAELLGPLAGVPLTRSEFGRGFVAEIDVRADAFLAHAAALAAVRPAIKLRVEGVAAHAADFLRCPHLGAVTGVSVYASPLGRPLVEPPTDDELSAGAKRLTRLEELDLEGCGVGDAFCELFGRFDLPALTSLDLSHNAITDAGVENLLRTHHPRRLRRLILGGNDITDVGAVALASGWPTGAGDRLKTLNLRFTGVGHVGQRALLDRFGGRVDLF